MSEANNLRKWVLLDQATNVKLTPASELLAGELCVVQILRRQADVDIQRRANPAST